MNMCVELPGCVYLRTYTARPADQHAQMVDHVAAAECSHGLVLLMSVLHCIGVTCP